MKIIFGQGNPGSNYAKSRHNLGFRVLDEIAQKWGGTFKPTAKFHATIAEVSKNGEKVLLVKPDTFYNETGLAARALINFYKLDPTTDLLVIHDELALPFGVIKTRASGSDAGNNGIKSLNAHLGPSYLRLRLGVYTPQRDEMNDADFVLGTFTKEEGANFPYIFADAEKHAEAFVSGVFTVTRSNTLYNKNSQ